MHHATFHAVKTRQMMMEGMPGRLPKMDPADAKAKGNEAFKAGKLELAIHFWQVRSAQRARDTRYSAY